MLLQLLQHADDRLASAPISRPGSDLDVIWRSEPGHLAQAAAAQVERFRVTAAALPPCTRMYFFVSSFVPDAPPLSGSLFKSEPDRARRRAGAPPGALSSARRTVRAMASLMTSPITSPITSPVTSPAMTQHKMEAAVSASRARRCKVWIASSPMRTGRCPMCSGASSVMWEAAAPHFQVVGALSCLYAYTSR